GGDPPAGPGGGCADLRGQPLRRSHSQRADGADGDFAGRRGGNPEAGGGGPDVPWCGCGQPGPGDHSPGPAHVADQAAARLGEAQAGDRAGDWPHEGRLPDGALLAAGVAGRRAACGAVCGRLQHPVAAAGDHASGHQAGFFAPIAAVVARQCWRHGGAGGPWTALGVGLSADDALPVTTTAGARGAGRILQGRLKNRFGRGPSGCVVFRNGGSACIQINILAPGTWRVLEGTAMDIDGNPIAVPSYDTIRNGGGLGLTIRPGPPPSALRAGPRRGDRWLACGWCVYPPTG